MKKTLMAVLFFGVGIVSTFFYYNFSTGDSTASGFLDWLTSFYSRLTLKVTAETSDDPIAIAASFIANQEGFSPVVYTDAGHQAIGYGHDLVDGDGFDSTSTITESDALALLQQDLANFVSCVNSNVKVSLNPNQFAALYSFCYNIGCGAFRGSTLLKKINAGDFVGASGEFPRWDLAEGAVNSALVSRRAAEQNLFNS